MLKRLELSGFKSFAERTVFDLSPGITAIVGPNGSGKSNIVDAIRWVLGEQSARSLRGTGMADVLFNGTRTRKPLNLAEVSLTFDNSSRILPLDAPDIRITRRLFRDGVSEYQINGQTTRLKDIRDLLLGSGAEAYSIIAQGQVDALLNANPDERRHVFEEAAGISRFRVRRQETLKRLEKVSQNIQLLDSQIERLEKQLRQARAESAKAMQRLELQKEYQSLRSMRDLVEFAGIEREIKRFIQEPTNSPAEDETPPLDPGNSKTHLEEMRRRRSDLSARGETLRESLAQWSHERSQEWNHLDRYLEEQARLEGDLTARRGSLAGLWEKGIRLSSALSALQVERAELHLERGQLDEKVKEDREAIERLRGERAAAGAQSGEIAQALLKNLNLRNDQTARAVQAQGSLSSLQKEINRTITRQQQVRGAIRQQLGSLTALVGEKGEAEKNAATLSQERTAALGAYATAQADFSRVQKELHRVRLEQEACRGRAEVLEHLERSREGLASGVREVFALLDGPEPGPWNTVIGLAGEFLHVRREYAPLLDLLLGEKSQRILVRDEDLLSRALASAPGLFSARVSFLGPSTPDIEEDPVDWGGQGGLFAEVPRGVVALAENLARCDLPGFLDLPQKLLSQALVVEDLRTARQLRGRHPSFRFITLTGEILEPDGTLTVGKAAADSGIVSRKAELRELRDRIHELQARERVLETQLDAAQAAVDSAQTRVETLERQTAALADKLAALKRKIEETQSRIESLETEAQSLGGELRQAHNEMAQWSELLDVAQREGENLAIELAALEERQAEAIRLESETATSLAHMEKRYATRLEKLQSVDLELRSVESAWQTQVQDREKVISDIAATQESLENLARSTQLAAQMALYSGQAVARIEHAREQILKEWVPIQTELADLDQRIEMQEREREAIQEAFNLRRERHHRLQLSLQEKNIKRDALLARTREENGRDLVAEWEASSVEIREELAQTPLAPLERKIAELKQKLAQLGPGDPWTLSQLEQWEKDQKEMALYRHDLFGARAILVEILQKLDSECSRMFLATFEEIRGQFQDLFRKLFGGGQADLVLERPGEALDSPIEIQARPPGKEMRSLVLLSGGEKTMTVVALLLAIFRSRPSPFCLMDEVDAALDESNVGRFAGVLRQFCDRTQFLLITHSKKTMSVADTLLGITMQESGVSTRVAVRIEDWAEDEQKKKAA